MGRWQSALKPADGGVWRAIPLHHDRCAVAVPLPFVSFDKLRTKMERI